MVPFLLFLVAMTARTAIIYGGCVERAATLAETLLADARRVVVANEFRSLPTDGLGSYERVYLTPDGAITPEELADLYGAAEIIRIGN